MVYREGDVGPWTVISGTNGRYELPVAADAYTAAVICPLTTFRRRVVLYELRGNEVAEITHLGACRESAINIAGSVMTGSQGARFYWSESTGYAMAGTYTFAAPSGTYDLVAVRESGNNQLGNIRGDRAVIQRSVAATGNVTLDVDLSDTGGIATRKHVVNGLEYNDRGSVVVSTELVTARGTHALISSESLFDTLPLEVNTLPASALEPGEFNLVIAEHYTLTTVNPSTWRVEERAVRDVSGDIAVGFTIGPGTQPQIGWDSLSPYVLLHTLWRPEPAPAYRFVAEQLVGNELVEWTINTSTPTMNAAGEFTWIVPDFSAVPGWSPSLGFAKQQSIRWQMVGRSGAELEQLIQMHPTQELTIKSNGWAGTIATPAF